MNLISGILLTAIAVLFLAALRYTMKHGSCSECGKHGTGGCSSCCGSCAACHGCGTNGKKKEVQTKVF